MHESKLHNGLNSRGKSIKTTTTEPNRGKTGENKSGRDLLEGLDTTLTGSMAGTKQRSKVCFKFWRFWKSLSRRSQQTQQIMAGLEILSPEGLRLDGRRPHELRKIVCRMGVFKQADGSAYIEMGNTKALATVYGPHEVTNKSKILHDRVLLNCQFSMATFSTGERKKRPKGDRRSTETSMLIRRTFEAAILTQLYPRSQIDIYVQVISIVSVVVHPIPRILALSTGVYTTQVNSTFRARWLASSEVISQVLSTTEQPKKNEMALVGVLSK